MSVILFSINAVFASYWVSRRKHGFATFNALAALWVAMLAT